MAKANKNAYDNLRKQEYTIKQLERQTENQKVDISVLNSIKAEQAKKIVALGNEVEKWHGSYIEKDKYIRKLINRNIFQRIFRSFE